MNKKRKICFWKQKVNISIRNHFCNITSIKISVNLFRLHAFCAAHLLLKVVPFHLHLAFWVQYHMVPFELTKYQNIRKKKSILKTRAIKNQAILYYIVYFELSNSILYIGFLCSCKLCVVCSFSEMWGIEFFSGFGKGRHAYYKNLFLPHLFFFLLFIWWPWIKLPPYEWDTQ